MTATGKRHDLIDKIKLLSDEEFAEVVRRVKMALSDDFSGINTARKEAQA